jgi:hypothetical protein
MDVVPRSHDRLNAQDFQPEPRSSRPSPKISPNTENPTSSGNSLDNLLRQKKSRHLVSRREKTSKSIQDTPLGAEFGLGPIHNLISTIRSRHCVNGMGEVGYRLHRESNDAATQNATGIVEVIYEVPGTLPRSSITSDLSH